MLGHSTNLSNKIQVVFKKFGAGVHLLIDRLDVIYINLSGTYVISSRDVSVGHAYDNFPLDIQKPLTLMVVQYFCIRVIIFGFR